jgi:competence protein ComEC
MNKPVLFIFTALIVANIFSWSLFVSVYDSKFLKVDFLNVGQGDSTLIKTPSGQKILIDGGPNYNLATEELAKEIPFWDKEIDLVILSHPEQDHFAGLFKVFKLYKVKNIVWSGDIKDTELFRTFETAVSNEQKEDGAKVYKVDVNDKILFGSGEIDVLYPFEMSNSSNQESANGNCLVLKLLYKKTSFLFTGDIGFTEEQNILKSQENIDADILKVAHHGSKYSSSIDFLKAVSPKVSIIQVGKDNTYGHPTKETLQRLDEVGSKIYRNDLNGNVEVVSDGLNLKILSEN